MPPTAISRGRGLCLVVTVTVVVVAVTACQRPSPVPPSTDTSAVDDGTTLTMWTRSLTAEFSRRLVDAYNQTHRNKVKLTVMPADSYQQRVGVAAGAGQLPDLLAADVVYAPNYTSNGFCWT